MAEIRVVLIFNEDNDRQKEIGMYLKSQKRCKTAFITELVYGWLHKTNPTGSFSGQQNNNIEEIKQQLLQDKEFLQQIKEKVTAENTLEVISETEEKEGLDIDEGMLMAGLSMFENRF